MQFLYAILEVLTIEGGSFLKTFKMLSFDIQINGAFQSIPLVDGIIINQENSHQLWVIEAFTSAEHKALFDSLIASAENYDARVIISSPDNEPAPFELFAHSLTQIQDNISVLFKGRIKVQRKKYAELLLSQLLAQGLRDDALLIAFEKGMRERPSLQQRQGNE